MDLAHALRMDSTDLSSICFVGAGGKTTSLFQLASQLVKRGIPRVIVTATSHLGTWQTEGATRHIIASNVSDLAPILDEDLRGAILVTGPQRDDRFSPITVELLKWLREKSAATNSPLLIEADGAREHPLKAPASHEPPIPQFVENIIVLAGLSGLGKTLNDEFVHRPEIFSRLAGLPLGQEITPQDILNVLMHPEGGLKNIPPGAQRIAFLNQADTPALQSIAGSMASTLLGQFDQVLIGSLQQNQLQSIERTAGIILAAGAAKRYGSPKQLLDWHEKPFVRHVAETALRAGLDPVVVVTGAYAAEVETAVKGLSVRMVHNAEYAHGQSTSIKAGLASAPSNTGASIFLLADQPQIPVEVLLALKETHYRELPAILAPLVLEEKRANPVLFDRRTFPHLMQLTGDTGGRAIFDRHRVEYLPWHDDILLFDVDKPEDYQRLKEME
jgi:molybdenum cofactor cytidylyltransferase